MQHDRTVTTGITYFDPHALPESEPEIYFFEIDANGRRIEVTVSREAIDDDASKRGMSVPIGREGHLAHLKSFQPEFVAIAVKKHRLLETVHIESSDTSG